MMQGLALSVGTCYEVLRRSFSSFCFVFVSWYFLLGPNVWQVSDRSIWFIGCLDHQSIGENGALKILTILLCED